MSENYKNVTKEWLKNATPNSHEVKEAKYFKNKNGIKYYVDGKYVILDYSKKEKEVAEWLKETLGGKIYMCPRINNPEGLKTPDYLFKNMLLDLKEIKGSGKRTIDSAIKNKSSQAANFIFDVSESSLSEEEVIKQVKNIYSTAGRQWINVIIIKKHSKLIAVYKKRN